MDPNISKPKWMFIIISVMCILMIFALYQKAATKSGNPLSTLISSSICSSIQTGEKDLIFIGSSTATVNENMTLDEADIAFFNFVSNLHFVCENSIRFGNILDGGWDMCIAEPYRPKKSCLVYSFGINNDFSFDDAISKSFNCTVRAFDPSMKAADHQRSDKVWFYKIGIGGSDTFNPKNNWTMKTLPSIISSFGETEKIIDYLKMDIESSEWPSLEPMLADDALSRVKQFGVEIHMGNINVQTIYQKYKLLTRLEDAGFKRWYFARNYYALKRTKNGFRSCCYEMVYINSRFLKT